MKVRQIYVAALVMVLAVGSAMAQHSESLYAGDAPSYAIQADGSDSPSGSGYLGVDDFFRIREANPNVKSCQWQFELNSAWSTFRSGAGRDDDWTVGASLKYGITDDVFAEFEVLPVNFGDGSDFSARSNRFRFGRRRNVTGDDGNGESNLKLFWRFLREQDIMPAMAVWSELRLPTGEGSSKMDWNIRLNATKTIWDRFRAHMAGWLETDNGARGGFDNRFFGDRRNFQWGMGAGVDYSLDEQNVLVLNYENRSSEYDGNSNTNSFEAGWVHHLSPSQQLMVGTVYDDTRGFQEGPRWTAKVQWSVAF